MQKELLSSLENLTKCNLQSIDYFIGKENVIYDFEFNFGADYGADLGSVFMMESYHYLGLH